MGAASGLRGYVMESSRSRPSVALRIAAALSFIATALISGSPSQASIPLASSIALLAVSARDLRVFKALTAVAVPVVGVAAYSLLTSSMLKAVVIAFRILTLASSSLAVVYGASIGEVLWLSTLFKFSRTLMMATLTSLESAALLTSLVREAEEGVRARGVGGRGFKALLRKYTLIAKILFYRALVRAEVSAEVLFLGITDPLRIKPLYRLKLCYWDAVVAALTTASITSYALTLTCTH